jgi:GDP-L-fucose synthase
MAKVLVTGHTGLAGNAILSELMLHSDNVFGMSSAELDLRDREKVIRVISELKPTVIVNAAAIVGGILANRDSPVRFLSENLQMQTNLIDAAHQASVEKFIFLGSSCIYPRETSQPIAEEQILNGPLEKTNESYAIAKIAGVKLIEAYNSEFGYSWVSLMPSSLYGPFDTFDKVNGHVIPSLFAKIEQAQRLGISSVELWGTGSPLREFLHSHDLAAAVRMVIENPTRFSILNVGSGVNISIGDLALLIAEVVGYKGEIVFNPSFPDGTLEKLMNSSRMRELGWEPTISLEEGLRKTYAWYLENVSKLRGASK